MDYPSQSANLDDLIMIYLGDPRGATAAALQTAIRRQRAALDLSALLVGFQEAFYVLPAHEPQPGVAAAQTPALQSILKFDPRESFDSVAVFYGILEIASLIRYVPQDLPEEFAVAIAENLSEQAVRQSYEKHRSILLPLLLRQRLSKTLVLQENLPDDSAPVHRLYVEFLGMINQLQNDDDIGVFELFLESGTFGSYRLESTFAALRDPMEFCERTLKPPAERDHLDRSLRGMLAFFAFCVEFDRLLERCAAYPLFQSALFHYFFYWFDQIGDTVSRRVGEALDIIVQWPNEKLDHDLPDVQQEARQYVELVKQAVSKLTSGSYGRALLDAVDYRATTVLLKGDCRPNSRLTSMDRVITILIPAMQKQGMTDDEIKAHFGKFGHDLTGLYDWAR